MENEDKNNPKQEAQQEAQQEVALAENGRRIHENDIIQILTKMSLATRSIIWELDPDDIKYLDSVIKKEIDGKKIITKKELRRELLRELYKEGDEKNANELT